MATHATDTEYRGADILPALSEQLKLIFSLDDAPATLDEWVEMTVMLLREDDITVDLDALCTDDSSWNTARIGETTHHFHCVLDAIVVPFLVDELDEIAIRATSPLTGSIVELQVTHDEMISTPEEAVVSIGVATDTTEPDADALISEIAYERFCPYTNAFPSRTEYEQWAEETDAETMAISTDEAYELARALDRAVHDE
ncbi:organomercurial lyase [Haladaptatus halobius]|uniref:organomercurial lyase n=1 Tax=Haladaptatus halobius TaxID=2884875 RepID=UPI001D0BDE60|nr:organomercurial lyase [Haladaptatus halobius]